MAPLDSIDVVLGSIATRLDKVAGDVNELHTKQREVTTRLDQGTLFLDDLKTRMRTLEAHDQESYDKHHAVASKVELLESKIDDMRSNLTKVIEGQMQILNSNTATREEFQGVLASQSKQHLDKMKWIRMLIYVGGGLFLIATQLYSQHVGNTSMMDSVVSFLTNTQKP